MPARRAGTGGWTWATIGVTAVTLAVVVLRFGLSPVLPAFCYLAAAGVPLAFIDARQRRLPDVLTLPSYPACLLLLGVAAPFLPGGSGRFVHALVGMAAAVAFFGLLLLVSPAGISLGLGDVLTELRRRVGRAADRHGALLFCQLEGLVRWLRVPQLWCWMCSSTTVGPASVEVQ